MIFVSDYYRDLLGVAKFSETSDGNLNVPLKVRMAGSCGLVSSLQLQLP